MLGDKKVPAEKKEEIRALMPLVNISLFFFFLSRHHLRISQRNEYYSQIVVERILIRLTLLVDCWVTLAAFKQLYQVVLILI